MRVLIENSGYGLTNLGDVAMLQVAVQRIQRLWPDSHIEIITADPTLCRKFCPGTQPLVIPSLTRWDSIRRLADPQVDAVSNWMRRVKKKTWQSFLGLESGSFERKWKGYVDAARQADLVVATGGGYINDTFVEHGVGVLSTLEVGLNCGKPVAIVGHGFEPISNPTLLDRAETVLPRLLLIGCRERKFGPSALAALQVPTHTVYVGGDDAVELAYQGRTDEPGEALGVNLRVTWYAGVEKDTMETVRTALHDAGRKVRARLLPLPIALRCPSDAASIQWLLKGYPETVDFHDPDLPIHAVWTAGRCRAVVSGSYHGAVFALSQGIPAVCLAQTSYYVHKFEGLQDMFGPGCYVIPLYEQGFGKRLGLAIEEAWERAGEHREALLQAAEQQIEASWEGYRRLCHEVGEHYLGRGIGEAANF